MTKKRNNMIAEDYVAGASVEKLAGDYGIGTRMIHRILRAKGLTMADRKKQPQRPRTQEPRSQLHLKIGKKLHDHYFVVRQVNRAQAADDLGISAKALRGIELGMNPLCLTDLQNIASYMKTTVGELVDGS